MRALEYTYPVETLYTGSSLGNLCTFARLDRETNLNGLWSSSDNHYYVGEWDLEVRSDGILAEPKETVFTPASQITRFTCGPLIVEKEFFLPWQDSSHEEVQELSNLRSAIFLLRLQNSSPVAAELSIHHTILFPATIHDRFTKKPADDQIAKRVRVGVHSDRCEITTLGRPLEARVFGSTAQWSSCSGDDRMLNVEFPCTVPPAGALEIPFVLSFSPEGVDRALDGFMRCRDTRRLLDETVAAYERLLARTWIFTPDPVINRALQWAKVNTVRVQHRFRIGNAFTNDPPQDVVVIRDLAWYILGADYVTPEFSRDLIDFCKSYAIHDGGKLTEYIHADKPVLIKHDYQLNINDDTPLFVLAAYHHAVTSESTGFLLQVYPLMKRACDWILTQISDGLVRCTAKGKYVWGICGWRNVIDGYTLAGAVTEINAECYHALKLTAGVARWIGRDREADRFHQASENLLSAINSKLMSERTGLYLLTIDTEGVARHDVTGDEVFPVLFDVAGSEIRDRILKRLTDDDMWTPYGSRTVSKSEHNYDPDFGYQLVGGVWPNLTAWIAFCMRKNSPRKLVEGMLNAYRLSETPRPVDFVNVVPGQFPERLHGETFVSRGMTMSPWMPATYLWLGTEGLLGVRATLDGLELDPAVPEEWGWIAVRNLLYKEHLVSAFLYDGTVYSTHPFKCPFPVKVGLAVSVASDNKDICTVGLLTQEKLVVFVASDREAEGTITVEHENAVIEEYVDLTKGQARLLHFPVSTTLTQTQTTSVGP